MKRKSKIILYIIVVVCIVTGSKNVFKDLPTGLSAQGAAHAIASTNITFLSDITYLDENEGRVSQQEIFPEVYSMIEQANKYILIDMFLFNDMLGTATESYSQLSSELTQKLLDKKESTPEIQITFITDPINTVYGGDMSAYINQLKNAGINVIVTDLTKLRDSNPLYSAPWRVFGQWWGNSSERGWLPHVMDVRREKLTLRTYLRLFNFKANHRKVIMSDYNIDGKDGYATLITSANPHDGSSAHSNVALRIDSSIWRDVYDSEKAVVDFSGGTIAPPPTTRIGNDEQQASEVSEGSATVQLVTEGKIKNALLQEIDKSQSGDNIDMMMFYFSDRDVVKALKKAASRGVKLRIILDPNKDAFGREKNGIPNRQVAHEIISNGGDINVRWCNTHGEQCHAKMTLFTSGDQAVMIMGSANLTRRNIGDYNLETNIVVKTSLQAKVIIEANRFFTAHWENIQQEFTLDYDAYDDSNKSRTILYRFMEATGLSSF